jgi:hypothetical protein
MGSNERPELDSEQRSRFGDSTSTHPFPDTPRRAGRENDSSERPLSGRRGDAVPGNERRSRDRGCRHESSLAG